MMLLKTAILMFRNLLRKTDTRIYSKEAVETRMPTRGITALKHSFPEDSLKTHTTRPEKTPLPIIRLINPVVLTLKRLNPKE